MSCELWVVSSLHKSHLRAEPTLPLQTHITLLPEIDRPVPLQPDDVMSDSACAGAGFEAVPQFPI